MRKLVNMIMGVCLLLVLFQCKKSESADPTSNADWQINTSDIAEATNATGEIVNQNNGPLVRYQVASSLIYKGDGNLYIFKMRFTSQDSLTCYIEKKTQDFNYHSDAAADQNKLHMVVFNKDTVQLKPSAISIQPRQDENKFITVSNIHTQNKGDFNGTVNGVPLVQ